MNAKKMLDLIDLKFPGMVKIAEQDLIFTVNLPNQQSLSFRLWEDVYNDNVLELTDDGETYEIMRLNQQFSTKNWKKIVEMLYQHQIMVLDGFEEIIFDIKLPKQKYLNQQVNTFGKCLIEAAKIAKI